MFGEHNVDEFFRYSQYLALIACVDFELMMIVKFSKYNYLAY